MRAEDFNVPMAAVWATSAGLVCAAGAAVADTLISGVSISPAAMWGGMAALIGVCVGLSVSVLRRNGMWIAKPR